MGDADDLIARWLTELDAALADADIDSERADRIIAEYADHLECHTEAATELGLSPLSAAADACTAVGTPAAVAAAFAVTPLPDRRVRTASVHRGITAGFMALLPAVLVWVAAVVSPLGGVESPTHFLTSLGTVAESIAFVASPLLALVVGGRVNHRSHSTASKVLVVASLVFLGLGTFALTVLKQEP